MENITEEYLRQLAYLNQGNKNILYFVRRAYKEMMILRKELAKYEIV